jgi:hypothetical protein
MNLASPAFLSNGDIVPRFAGIPGVTYTIEGTDSMPPNANWQKVSNVAAPASKEGCGVGVCEVRKPAGTGEFGSFGRSARHIETPTRVVNDATHLSPSL